jgi:beta-glucosidase
MYLTGKPLFAFGHGLSYTEFKYSNLRLSSTRIKSDGTVSVSVDIQNTGKRTGDEVVQLYVHEVNPRVKRPIEELRGFARIALDAGVRKTVILDVPAQKLSYYDERVHAFVVNPGAFDVMVGAASDDIRLKARVTVTSSAP